MKKIVAIGLLAALLQQYGTAQNQWTKVAYFAGEKRERAVGFAIGNMGYVGLGKDTAEQAKNDLWQFDPAANTWTQKANFPGVARINAASFVIANKAYVGTGLDGVGNPLVDFYEYNPATNAWVQKAPYPDPGPWGGIREATGFALNGKGYVCCGRWGPDWYSNRLWEYDPGTNMWAQKAAFPGGDRYSLCSFVLKGKAYVGTGTDHDLARKDIWEYTPGNNTWAQKADLPGTQRTDASTFVLNDSLGYIVFGTNGGFLNDLWEYNPATDSWMIRSAFPGGGRRNAVAFNINGKGYGGCGQSATGARRNFYQYSPFMVLGKDELSNTVAEVSVFPNPVARGESLTVNRMHPENSSLFIYNQSGKLMMKVNVNHQATISLETEHLESGTYIYVVGGDNIEEVRTGKFIVL